MASSPINYTRDESIHLSRLFLNGGFCRFRVCEEHGNTGGFQDVLVFCHWIPRPGPHNQQPGHSQNRHLSSMELCHTH